MTDLTISPPVVCFLRFLIKGPQEPFFVLQEEDGIYLIQIIVKWLQKSALSSSYRLSLIVFPYWYESYPLDVNLVR